MDVIISIMSFALIFMTLYLFWFWFCFGKCVDKRQKTRIPQRRMNAGSRTRTSLSQGEPTVYISPANYPPPPKYEAMAPPSYEEVVGVHYPNYQPPATLQPITQPLTTAIAQSSSIIATPNNNNENVTKINVTDEVNPSPSTVITVTTDERRRSVTVTATS